MLFAEKPLVAGVRRTGYSLVRLFPEQQASGAAKVFIWEVAPETMKMCRLKRQ